MKMLKIFGAAILLLLLESCGDYVVDLAGGYVLYSEAPDTQFIWPEDGIRAGELYVPCNVVSYDYNDSHIVAKQVARVDCFLDGRNLFNQQDGITYFWIIDANKKIILGPFNEPEFKAQRESLGVSTDLKVDRYS